MKVFCIFGKNTNVSLFETNTVTTKELHREMLKVENKVISYTLNETPLTKKFIKEWLRYRKFQIDLGKGSGTTYHFNYYTSIDTKSIKTSKIEMNKTLTDLRNLGYDIRDDLFLNLDSDQDEMNKLNELHYIFEKKQIELSTSDEHYDKKFNLLEKVNSIVHFIEHNHETGHNSCYISVRPLSENNSNRYILVDEDYDNFTFINGGDLLADYNTVGKDLYACSYTNDIELIIKNEVKPQEILTDYIFMVFEYGENDYTRFEKHYRWCKSNNVDKYLDYTLPKHRPGRHILGKIDQPIYTGLDFMKEIYNKTPMFLGYYIGYDDGTPLLKESV